MSLGGADLGRASDSRHFGVFLAMAQYVAEHDSLPDQISSTSIPTMAAVRGAKVMADELGLSAEADYLRVTSATSRMSSIIRCSCRKRSELVQSPRPKQKRGFGIAPSIRYFSDQTDHANPYLPGEVAPVFTSDGLLGECRRGHLVCSGHISETGAG